MIASGRLSVRRASTARWLVMSSSPGPPGPLQASTTSPRARRARTRWVPTNPSAPVTRTRTSAPPAKPLDVGVHHHLHQLVEVDRRCPSQLCSRLRGIPDQMVNLGGTDELRIDHYVLLPIKPDVGERDLAELAHRVRLVGGDQVIVRHRLLHHQPHRPNVVSGKTPVSGSVQISHRELLLKSELDAGDTVADLPG